MYKRMLTFGLLIALMGGCASMTDRQQTQAQGAAVGTAGGAAVGAALGAIFGGKDGAIIGASVGAGMGLLAGAVYGTHVANQKAKFANEEDYLNAVIASAQQINNETRQYNASLAKEINDFDSDTRQLVRQYNQKLVSKKILEDKQRVVVAKLFEAEAQLKKVKNELNSQSKVLNQVQDQSSPQVAQWNSEIAELTKNRSALEEQVTKLAAIKTRVSV
jgi:cell division protein FtsB